MGGLLGGLLQACMAATGHAAPSGVSTGGCEVFASGVLRSGEYRASYSGGCRDGLAEGHGKAQWNLTYAPDAAPVVWQGRFSQGIFLAEPAALGARRVDSTRALLDMGSVRGPGGKAARLWVESRVDGKLPASICRPLSLRLLTGGADLADDQLARQWLGAAHQHWRRACDASSLAALKGRNVQIGIHQGTELGPDGYGNLPAAEVASYGTLDGQGYEPRQYHNKAGQAVADRQRAAERREALAASEKRLRDYAREVGARRYVDLKELEQNPFRFGEQVLLVAVRPLRVETPMEAIVQPARRVGHDYAMALAAGVQVAQWDRQSRILAVRVIGRSKEQGSQGMLRLAVVDSQACQASNCEDFIHVTGNRWLVDEEL